MSQSNTSLLIAGVLVLLAAMIALAFHLSAQRPAGPELVAPPSEVVGTSPEVVARTLPVRLYAYDPRLDMDASGNVLCSAKGLVAVDRTIPHTEATLRASLELLLADPLTPEERARGLTTEFPLEGVRLEGVSIEGDMAVIALADPKRRLSGGSCRVGILYAQLAATAKQFRNIDDVRITPETVLQP